MRKPPPKVARAIEALVTGQARTITAAAKKVGLSRERLSRAFSEPHNRQALRERVDREVALSSGRAAARLTKLIDSGSERVAFEATRFSLGVAGIKPAADTTVNIGVGTQLAGYVIDLSGRKPGVKVIERDGGAVIDVLPEPIAGIGPDGSRTD
jgi:hypothetical protein